MLSFDPFKLLAIISKDCSNAPRFNQNYGYNQQQYNQGNASNSYTGQFAGRSELFASISELCQACCQLEDTLSEIFQYNSESVSCVWKP